jgi:glyoxylase I family protein
MKIEHFAINVKDAAAMADWYVKNLAMKVVRKGPPPVDGHFLADSAGAVMVEIYNNTTAPVLDFAAMDPLLVHLAFVTKDLQADQARLLAAGASVAAKTVHADNGDVIATLRDPWGFAIQLAQRAKPMI